MPLDLAYATGSAVSITATEMSIGVTGGTTTGVPVSRTDTGLYTVMIDGVANLVQGDEIRWRVYEKARAAGTQRVILTGLIRGAQSEPLVLPSLPLGIGWDATLQLISATARALDWSLRRVS